MPCYDPRDEELKRNCKQDLDERTSMLCNMCKAWEKAGKPFLLPKEVSPWWGKHKQWDKERGA